MKQTLLIALLALAGFTALPGNAADAPAPAAAAPAPTNLAAPGKPPCNKPGMGMGMGPGAGMPAMLGQGRACPKSACDCPMHAEMSARVQQLEKRIDALQMTLEVLARQQVK